MGVLLAAVLLQAWFYNWKVELSARRVGPVDAAAGASGARPAQLQRIETYGWADPKTKKDRAIPISRAMELVAKDLAESGKKGGGK